jgi:opacity protein-like surface antigen
MIPEGNFSDVAENGYHAFVGYAWGFGPVEIEPALRYMWADGVQGAADVKIFGGEVSGRVQIFFLYAVGGVGYYKVERTIDLDNLIEIDSFDFSWSIGAGVEIGPVFLEARYQVIESERDTAFFPITVGFRF